MARRRIPAEATTPDAPERPAWHWDVYRHHLDETEQPPDYWGDADDAWIYRVIRAIRRAEEART